MRLAGIETCVIEHFPSSHEKTFALRMLETASVVRISFHKYYSFFLFCLVMLLFSSVHRPLGKMPDVVSRQRWIAFTLVLAFS